MAFNFPNAPVDGEVFDTGTGQQYVYQTPVWIKHTPPYRLVTYKTSDTWLRPPGCKYIDLEACGAGGGSGGIKVTLDDGWAVTGGAAAAVWGQIHFIDVSAIPALTITIGAAGAKGIGVDFGLPDVPTSGGTGGITMVAVNAFQRYVWGGAQGSSEATTIPIGAKPPVYFSGGFAGDLWSAYQQSNFFGTTAFASFSAGWFWDNNTEGLIITGAGGHSPLGYGGTGSIASLTDIINAGGDFGVGSTPPSGYGAGAGGAMVMNHINGPDGGMGSPGIVIIKEYY